MGKKKNKNRGITSPEVETGPTTEVLNQEEEEVSLDNVKSPEPIEDSKEVIVEATKIEEEVPALDTTNIPDEVVVASNDFTSVTSPQTDPSSILLAKLQDLHDEDIRKAQEREAQLEELVHTLERQLNEQAQQTKRSNEIHLANLKEVETNNKLNIENLTRELDLLTSKNQKVTNQLAIETESKKLLQEELKSSQEKNLSEVQALRAQVTESHNESTRLKQTLLDVETRSQEALTKVMTERDDLIRKFYHHAFLAVKLNMELDKSSPSVNFDINDMLEQAITENVQEGDLNEWIGRKLNFRVTPMQQQIYVNNTETVV
ncbi:hypothetical protein AKO1_004793 [Acrasis kona]|uniref:Uncharacterized protein n=1 Tax=Acrasis kona TaxID=1008807 RepID=A0AAW2Z474_9EUKA